MFFVDSSPMFWPTGRKLFRQRSRLRVFVPVAAVLAMAVLVLAYRHAGWV